jgi:hypothetical protein
VKLKIHCVSAALPPIVLTLLAYADPPITFDDPDKYPITPDIRGRAVEGYIWQSTGALFAYDGSGNADCAIGKPTSTNGYKNAVVSKPRALPFYSASLQGVAGWVCSSPSKRAFIPQSIYATAAWRNSMTLTFTGHDASGAAGNTLTATINYEKPTKIDLTPLGQIYAMSFKSSGGVLACRDDVDPGRQFSFDDFVAISK